MKRMHVFNNVEMRFGLWKYTFLVMQKYGHDESVPYACGMFTTNFVGERESFVEYSHPISWANATNSRNVRCGIPIRATHYYNICNTSSQTVRNIIVTRPQLIS